MYLSEIPITMGALQLMCIPWLLPTLCKWDSLFYSVHNPSLNVEWTDLWIVLWICECLMSIFIFNIWGLYVASPQSCFLNPRVETGQRSLWSFHLAFPAWCWWRLLAPSAQIQSPSMFLCWHLLQLGLLGWQLCGTGMNQGLWWRGLLGTCISPCRKRGDMLLFEREKVNMLIHFTVALFKYANCPEICDSPVRVHRQARSGVSCAVRKYLKAQSIQHM